MSVIDKAVEKAGGQTELADRIGVSQGMVSQWVNGAPIHPKHFVPIAKLAGVTEYEVLDDELAKLKRRARESA